MRRFAFTPSLQTGNIDFDVHCRTLLAMANTILYSQELQKSHDLFRRAVKFLFAYLDYHFLAEELVMARTNYPSRQFHSAFHVQLRREASKIETRVERKAGYAEVTGEIYFLIEDWLVYHVVCADYQLASFLRDAGQNGALPRLPSITAMKAEGSLPSDFDEHMVEVMARLAPLESAPR
jgi:hemerythrin-like metal-binding protein